MPPAKSHVLSMWGCWNTITSEWIAFSEDKADILELVRDFGPHLEAIPYCELNVTIVEQLDMPLNP